MYTATVKKKELIDGVLLITVAFSDGTKTVTDSCKPQDRAGFDYWVKSKLATLNGAVELDMNYAINDVVDISDSVVTPPTQAELDKQMWFAKYGELETLEKIASKNFLTGPRLTYLNNKIASVKTFLDTNGKTEYLDFI